MDALHRRTTNGSVRRCTQTADEARKMLPIVEVAVSREDLG
jgi:hypothetical protein